MLEYIPGTEPLRSFKDKGGRFLSVMLDGEPDSEAENLIVTQISNSTYSAEDAYILDKSDFIETLSRKDHRFVSISCNHIHLLIYSDFSLMMVDSSGAQAEIFPIGIRLNQDSITQAIRDANGFNANSVSTYRKRSFDRIYKDLKRPRYSALLREVFADAESILTHRKRFGTFLGQPKPSNDVYMFPPLRGRHRDQSLVEIGSQRLFKAIVAELAILQLGNGNDDWRQVTASLYASYPMRDGSIEPARVVLKNADHLPTCTVAEMQAIFDAYCASYKLQTSRYSMCFYHAHGRFGNTIEPQKLILAFAMKDYTAHEITALAIQRDQNRSDHADEIALMRAKQAKAA